jgi:hypothetical protein
MLAEINWAVNVSMLFWIPIIICLSALFVCFVVVPVLTGIMKRLNCYNENLVFGLYFCSQIVIVFSLFAIIMLTTLWIAALVLVLISQIPIF